MSIRSNTSERASFFGAAVLAVGLLVSGVAPTANADTISCSQNRNRAAAASSFPNGSLCLVSGAFKAVFQMDGNLVIYKNKRGAIWSSQTSGRGANKIVVQGDSNLVIYNGNSALWQSGTNQGKRWNGTIVKMQSDGNLVVYGIGDGTEIALWSSGTAGS